MREHKFRGLNTKNEWVYGSLVTATHGIKKLPWSHTKTWIVETAFSNGGWFNVVKKQYVRPETVCETTNLPDEDGKEIFEADKIIFKDLNLAFTEAIVYFKDGCFYADDKNPAGNVPLSYLIENKRGVKVVGTKFDIEF